MSSLTTLPDFQVMSTPMGVNTKLTAYVQKNLLYYTHVMLISGGPWLMWIPAGIHRLGDSSPLSPNRIDPVDINIRPRPYKPSQC